MQGGAFPPSIRRARSVSLPVGHAQLNMILSQLESPGDRHTCCYSGKVVQAPVCTEHLLDSRLSSHMAVL